MRIETTKTFNITINEEEFKLLFEGIGNTSHSQMVDSGMTDEQASFFCEFYRFLAAEKE